MHNRTTVRRPANHALHLILTVLTLGMWSPVWIVCAIVGRREVITHAVAFDPYAGAPGTHPVPVALPVWNPYSGTWQ